MPEAAQLGIVDTGLDGENHARLEQTLLAPVQEWRLVSLQANRMSDVVAEPVLHAQLFGQLQDLPLDLGQGQARPQHSISVRPGRIAACIRRWAREAQSQLSWMHSSSRVDLTRRSASTSISPSATGAPVRSLKRGPRYPQ